MLRTNRSSIALSVSRSGDVRQRALLHQVEQDRQMRASHASVPKPQAIDAEDHKHVAQRSLQGRGIATDHDFRNGSRASDIPRVYQPTSHRSSLFLSTYPGELSAQWCAARADCAHGRVRTWNRPAGASSRWLVGLLWLPSCWWLPPWHSSLHQTLCNALRVGHLVGWGLQRSPYILVQTIAACAVVELLCCNS